mgnify:CR=1 FL=1
MIWNAILLLHSFFFQMGTHKPDVKVRNICCKVGVVVKGNIRGDVEQLFFFLG